VWLHIQYFSMVYFEPAVTSRDGHGAGVRLYFSDPEPDPDLNFWVKAESEFGMNGMMYIECM